MIREGHSAPSFDDFLQIGLVRPGNEPAQAGDAADVRRAGGRKFWIALCLLGICWMAWGAVLAHWLLLAELGMPGSLHSVLLALLAAAGGLVTIMALSATRAMEQARQSRPRSAVPAAAPAPHRMTPPPPAVSQPAPAVAMAMPAADQPRTSVPPPIPVVRIPQIIDEGEMMGRAYRLFSDGSIEIATLLGLRRFASLSDARQFIGPGDRGMTV